MSKLPFAMEDGRVYDAYIREEPGIHCACRLRYRPLPMVDRSVKVDELEKIRASGRSREAENGYCAEIAKRIVEWTFLDENGKPIDENVPVSAAIIQKAVPKFFSRLSGIVFYGSDPGDKDPLSNEEPVSAQKQLEADSKNS